MEQLTADFDPDRRATFGPLELGLEQLLRQWDPIGVYGMSIAMDDGSTLAWPADEYDDLVRPLLGSLRAGTQAHVFEWQLNELIERDYGLTPPLDLPVFVEQVYAWWARQPVV